MTAAAAPGGGLDLDQPFWRFALRVYAQPGVSPLCLALQDENGIDVNLLLFACWCGSTGRRLAAEDIGVAAAQTADWTAGVVGPLRQARRAWKAIGPDASDAIAGRETLKSVELLSERIVCAMLYAVHDRLGVAAPAGEPVAKATATNLELVLARSGVGPERAGAVSRTLIEACRAASH